MDKIEVSQRAREKAWAVRPGCYCEQDRTKWMAGVYDHVRIIQAFARFERDILATRTDATPVATDVAALVENGCEMPEVAAMRYIEELRSDLAASVTILCDNEEAWTKDEQMAVEVIAEWTDWIAKRFMGESVIQCLARAIGARATLAALKDRTHG